MAVRAFTSKAACSKGDHSTVIAWKGLLTGDEGKPFEGPGHFERSVQIAGTVPASAKIQIQGSNDGVTYQVLTSKHGNTLEFMGVGLSSIAEAVAFIKPVVVAGAPNAEVHLLAARHSRA